MLTHNNSKFDKFKKEMTDRIDELKILYGASFENSDHNKNLMKGSRWNNNSRIYYIFCGDLIEKVAKDKGLPPHEVHKAENDAVEEISLMDQQEIDVMLIEAMRDAANSDYWYRYEKDWDGV